MKFLIPMILLSLLSACSLIRTREEVKEEQKAAAEAEAPEPFDEKAVNDSLAEMGVDPDAATNDEKKTPEPEVDQPGTKKKKSRSR